MHWVFLRTLICVEGTFQKQKIIVIGVDALSSQHTLLYTVDILTDEVNWRISITIKLLRLLPCNGVQNGDFIEQNVIQSRKL